MRAQPLQAAPRTAPEKPVWAPQARYDAEMEADDPDSRMMRAACKGGRALRAAAREKRIDISGARWVDPSLLEPHGGRLVDVFGQAALSPAYRAWRDERSAALASALCADNMFHELCRDWHKYDDRQMVDKMAWFSKMQQYVFASGTMVTRVICLYAIREPKTADPDHPRVTRGAHAAPDERRRTHDILVNLHPDARFRHFADGMETIFHENLHAVQWGLADAFATGRIAEGHPLRRAARLFLMAGLEEESYIHGLDNVYKAHPLEQDTFEAGPRFVAMLKDGMAKAGIQAPGPA